MVCSQRTSSVLEPTGRLPLDQTVDTDNSSAASCNFTITEHACSSSEALTPTNVARLLECSLERQQTHPVEVWKLFFQRTSDLDKALDTLATMYPTNKGSSLTLANALEALGEVKLNKFSQAELLSQDFIADWFQKKLRLFLASPTTNFLVCLSSNNFSCVTYRTVVSAFATQMASMDRVGQQAVFTHFIVPFLSRKDSSDPGCISSVGSGDNWLQVNVGGFSEFASLQQLLSINPNFSSLQYLSELAPSQVATLVLRSGSSNDTGIIDQVFERLDTGNALQNVEEFLTHLAANGQIPVFQPAVRDRIMNRTFRIIQQQLWHFSTQDFYVWFNVRLRYILVSITPEMLRTTFSSINCTSYRVVVSGLASVYTDMTPAGQTEITQVLLEYLRSFAQVINTPVCRQGIQGDYHWIETNLGPFAHLTTYSDLKFFNISLVVILDFISPAQTAILLLEPNNLSNETLVMLAITRLTKSSSVNDLEYFFAKFVLDSTETLKTLSPSLLDSILNVTLTSLVPEISVLSTEDIKLWFQVYLKPFLPAASNRTFEIIPRNITCNSYQEIVKGFDNIFHQLSEAQNWSVFKFILEYLRGKTLSGLPCTTSGMDDRQWLKDNFGQFRFQASYQDFMSLKNNFNGVEVSDLLTVNQLGQLAATPSQLTSKQVVVKIMTAISPTEFDIFFDIVSPAVEAQSASYSADVKSAFIQAVFVRGNLSSPSVSDEEFLHWLTVRLRPLFVDLSTSLVIPLFQIGTNRSCNGTQEMIKFLNTLKMTFTSNTDKEIYRNILLFLQVPAPLKCYKNGSFYTYLKSSFLSFGFPNVSTFVSLLPTTRKSELLNTISPAELWSFLSQPNVIDDQLSLCDVFNNYNNTPAFLETENVPDDVKIKILPCFWHTALELTEKTDLDLWLEMRLKNYLKFLTKNLISYSEVKNASCFGFQKLVYYLGNNFIYSSSDFGRVDVYATIRSYLKAGSGTRCYNASDPNLNSTSWFANYIGSFVTLITLDDFKSFVSTSQMKAFLGDSTNLKLFSSTPVSEPVINYYITKLFELDPTFSLLKLPDFFFCSSEIPISAYTSLSQDDALVILERYQKVCDETSDTQVTVALASNIQTVTQQTLVKLGNGSSALSISQITSVSSTVLTSTLSTLGTVTTWSQIQVTTMVQILTNSGFKLDSSDSLLSLGTLVAGISSSEIQKISATVLLQATTSTTFVSNILMASTVHQQTFVQQILSLNTSPAMMVVNVPDALATAIPPAMLVFRLGTVDMNVLNQKRWTPEQSSMFFGLLAQTQFDFEQLSPYVLQGFTCKAIQNMKKSTILQLIHACRPRNDRPKVMLRESQLTCMYNQLRGSINQNFSEYPSDMLLYFESQDIQKNNCRSYFSKLGAADFSVVSSVLNKAPQLFLEATTCLGINSKSLSKDNVEVLGNMVCTLDGSYIENSDPYILEKLKVCKDFSNSQVAAMETLLLSGNTQYGNTSTWSIQTLKDLEILPLYLTRNFWSQFTSATKKQFLKSFMSTLRKANTESSKLKSLFKQISSLLVKRAASCTVGNITQVTISDESFPFGYDLQQFDFCLDVPVLKDNLDSICQKVHDENFQEVILKKLNQALPSGIPDQEVQMLGPVSRAASLDDISKWNISTVDTLGALMKPEDGVWTTAQSKTIITKYLGISVNSLGITELNMIDSYLCSLDVDTLKTITTESIRNAKPLNVTSCSPEQKKVLYEISNTSFRTYRDSSGNFYDLVKAYIGGAPVADVKMLSTQNISMDIDIFRSLQLDVIKALTVDDVQALMGNSLRDLKLFENDPIIQTWVNLQLQSDLDRLGLDLINNRTEAITASPSSSGNTPSSKQPSGTTTTGSTATTTTTSGSGSSTTSGSATTSATSGSATTSAISGSTTSSSSSTTDEGSSIFNGAKLMTPLPSLFLAALLIALQQILQQPA
ncbi:hypothetical protein OJAV_G00104920 [Oryzias javanicus]|uniref:Mesothelin n=1 Tax=Oryzias javanicus TaxID=123683 RepID=A0A3S2P932_ORYJA|nr:hypothetical protein OJAV_G00104920 [Oryzias javanicus]